MPTNALLARQNIGGRLLLMHSAPSRGVYLANSTTGFGPRLPRELGAFVLVEGFLNCGKRTACLGRAGPGEDPIASTAAPGCK
jgi:hypothetical protein